MCFALMVDWAIKNLLSINISCLALTYSAGQSIVPIATKLSYSLRWASLKMRTSGQDYLYLHPHGTTIKSRSQVRT